MLRTPDLDVLLRVGPFHAALRFAIQERGLTLARLRAHLERRGVSVGLSSLSDWQHGRSSPGGINSRRAVQALEQVLGLPPSSLLDLLPEDTSPLAAPRGLRCDRLGERQGALSELLDALPGSRENTIDVINQHTKVLIDAQRRFCRTWIRTAVRARRDGVDREVMRFFGEPGCDIEQVELGGLENCRLGRVLRHPAEPVLIAELLFDHVLRAGETWVFERHFSDPTGPANTETAHAFRHSEQQYVLEVRFHPPALPVSCHAFEQKSLHSERYRTTELQLNAHHAAHLIVSDADAGLVGIGWEWP